MPDGRARRSKAVELSEGVPLDPDSHESAVRFIQENTALIAPPLVPEIILHLATESVPIWQKSEEELGEMNVPPPFWAFAWAGGQALARYILDNPNICSSRRVLDLGSGSGLSAIAAAKCGALGVLAADIDRLAQLAIKLNADANGVAVTPTARDLLDDEGLTERVVIIGDLFYERQLAERVIAFIERMKEGGAAVLIGDPQRSYFPRNRFELLAEYQVPVTRELEDSEIKRSSVWRA